jgi:hypothetical protein
MTARFAQPIISVAVVNSTKLAVIGPQRACALVGLVVSMTAAEIRVRVLDMVSPDHPDIYSVTSMVRARSRVHETCSARDKT